MTRPENLRRPRWPKLLDERLEALWNRQGLTAERIRQELNAGVSRNAIIGRARRLKLDPRPSPIRRHPSERTPPP